MVNDGYYNFKPFIDDFFLLFLGIGALIKYYKGMEKNFIKCLVKTCVDFWFIGFGAREFGKTMGANHTGADFGLLILRTLPTLAGIAVFETSTERWF